LALHEQDHTQASGSTYHYHLDHLGTPRELTDTDGRIVWSARYRAYGNLALADVEAIDNPLRFQGQYYDQETGLHYNLNRYYDPNAGRFIHQDLIGLEGGNNLYQYAPNPIDWVDPFGLTCKQHLDVALKRQGYKSGDQYPSGFKEKWSENGYDYEVRIHGPDSKAPPGSNSATGTTYRVARRSQGLNANGQGSGWEYGDAAGNWYPTSFLKTAPVNPAANVAASATHIPIPLTPIP